MPKLADFTADREFHPAPKVNIYAIIHRVSYSPDLTPQIITPLQLLVNSLKLWVENNKQDF